MTNYSLEVMYCTNQALETKFYSIYGEAYADRAVDKIRHLLSGGESVSITLSDSESLYDVLTLRRENVASARVIKF